MFLDKYLNQTYLELVYDTYDENYLNLLDEDNFHQVYTLLKNTGFYFIDDIILNYMELFEIDEESVKYALSLMKLEFGNDYIKIIGNNMPIIDKIISIALNHSLSDEE